MSMLQERTRTSLAKVIEITADSPDSFEDAVQRAIVKASESVHGMRSAWVNGQQVRVEDGKVVAYRVDMKVTFVLD
jgi:flavin-binding protein dodecin